MSYRGYKLIIYYVNGSVDYLPYKNFGEVQDMYQNGISYSGGKVRRVECDDVANSSTRAIWDITWDEFSKDMGLRS